MKRSDSVKPFADGMLFLFTVYDMIMHPQGTIDITSTIQWALYYYPDWEYHASRFTD